MSRRSDFINTRGQLLDLYLEQLNYYLGLYPGLKLFPLALRWYGKRLPAWLTVRDAWAEVQNAFFDQCLDLDDLLSDPGNFQDEQGHLSYHGWEAVRKLFIANI